jgi:hypothetical protein
MSFSPQTGLVYFPAQELALTYRHDPRPVAREGFYNIGILFDMLPDDNAVRAAIKSASTGVLLAWDPVAQREVWRVNRRGPWNGGTLATAGGLVFQGTGDGEFVAMDAKTGKALWSTNNQAATLAGPITYEIAGEQYIADRGDGWIWQLVFSDRGIPGAHDRERAKQSCVRLQTGWHSGQARAQSTNGSGRQAPGDPRQPGRLCARWSPLRN